MRSPLFLLLVTNILTVTSTQQASACGPFIPIIPTPEFFNSPAGYTGDSDIEENLSLWQSITSPSIPLEDIREAVYTNTGAQWVDISKEAESNRFYAYLLTNGNDDIINFMRTAKAIEEKWAAVRSPWYFPGNRGDARGEGDMSEWDDLIARCKAYHGTRLADRYAFQIVRAFYASRDYSQCINYFDSAFVDIPDSNLMKRMAGGYVAGCWSRMGEWQRADTLFAKAGDIRSITACDPVALMASLNPDSPRIMEYIRSHVADSAGFARLLPSARKIIKRKATEYRGDWLFLLAYYYNEYAHDRSRADGYIQRALRQRFSNDELAALARAYKMKLDAHALRRDSLLSDLEWIEKKCHTSADSAQWVRRLRNIIYEDWVPQLWQKTDYATAIALCAYADNMSPTSYIIESPYEVSWNLFDYINLLFPNFALRYGNRYFNTIDYGSLSFQLMGSLSSAQLATAHSRMMKSTPLLDFLHTRIHTDTDYYYELIGTLALREENYARAVLYLSDVSPAYQCRMNIYKQGYLDRDAFTQYPSRWYSVADWEFERLASPHMKAPAIDAKLTFARRMLDYRRKMQNGTTPDERGMARLMYAIGRHNSFEECWALTQYWRGECIPTMFRPNLQYFEDTFAEDYYGFLYDYNTTVGHTRTEAIYDREVEAALAMLTTDEARAEAQRILGNLLTVVRHYPHTAAARRIKSTCDTWRHWL